MMSFKDVLAQKCQEAERKKTKAKTKPNTAEHLEKKWEENFPKNKWLLKCMTGCLYFERQKKNELIAFFFTLTNV